MTSQRQNRRRSFLAMLCLAAIALLYAPLGGAWLVYIGACCNTGQCPIHRHLHSQTPSVPEHTMNCGHEMATTTPRSMSCCHNPERPAVTPSIFVLPAPVTVSAVTNFEMLVTAPGPMNASHSPEPLSPPPRSSASAA